MASPRCSICGSATAPNVNVLLGSGASIREVSRLSGFSRSTVARHKQHVAPAARRLAIVPGMPPDGLAVDPMAEALKLLGAATTERGKMKALEAVRAASWLALRAMNGEPDADLLERLDRNVKEAAAMFREMTGLESQLYGLSGVREAIRHRIAATRAAEQVDVPFRIVGNGLDKDVGTIRLSAADYFRGVPARFRDPDRFTIARSIELSFSGPAEEHIEVRHGDALVWVSP